VSATIINGVLRGGKLGSAKERRRRPRRPPLTGKAVANTDPQWLARELQCATGRRNKRLFANPLSHSHALVVLPLSAVPGCCASSAPTTGPPVPRPRRPFAAKASFGNCADPARSHGQRDPFYDKSRPGRATAGQARNHRPTGIGPPGCQARLTHQALAPKRRRHYGPIRLGDADDRQPGKIGKWARNLLQGSELLDRPGRTGNSGALGRGPRYDRDRLSHLANLCR
jgi:hypothetical protein